MAVTRIDARNQPCPKPVLMTREALDSSTPGGSLEILVDNEIAAQNVQRFLTDKGLNPQAGAQGDHILISVTAGISESAPETGNARRTTPSRKGPVICVNSRTMGHGDEDLGDILMRAYINVLPETDPQPSTILFYNEGIFLALNGSPVLDTLQELSRAGVPILVCGTCTQHFGKSDEVAVGTISNMYDIAETLAGAPHVVYP